MLCSVVVGGVREIMCCGWSTVDCGPCDSCSTRSSVLSVCACVCLVLGYGVSMSVTVIVTVIVVSRDLLSTEMIRHCL